MISDLNPAPRGRIALGRRQAELAPSTLFRPSTRENSENLDERQEMKLPRFAVTCSDLVHREFRMQ